MALKAIITLFFYSNEWMIHRCVCALPHDVIVRLLFGETGRLDWSSRKENTFIYQDIPSKPVFPVRTAVKGPLAKPGEKVHFFFSQNHQSGRPVLNFCERPKLLQTLRCGFSAFPANVRSHVTRALPWDYLRFEAFVRLDHAPEVSDLPQGFFATWNITIPRLRRSTTF